MAKDNKILKALCEYGENDLPVDIIKGYLVDNDYSFDMSYDQDFYDETKDLLHYNVLKWCGCGNPEEADRAVLNYLNTLEYEDHYSYQDGGETLTQELHFGKTMDIREIYGGLNAPLLLCLMYVLDAAELTEHGSSVYGAWLTTKGLIFRICLRKFFEEYDKENEEE